MTYKEQINEWTKLFEYDNKPPANAKNPAKEGIDSPTDTQLDDFAIKERLFEIGYRYYKNSIVLLKDNVVALLEVGDINQHIALNIQQWQLIRVNLRSPIIKRENFKSFLTQLDDNFLRDTQTETYFYFKEFILKMTKNGIYRVDYKSINNFVWKSKIIDEPMDWEYLSKTYGDGSDFLSLDGISIQMIASNSVFGKFVQLVNTEPTTLKIDWERYKRLITALGYLINQHKQSSHAYGIVLSERNLERGAEGGTGKSLVIEAISKVRNVYKISKNYDKQFVYDGVTPDTDAIFLDELPKNYDVKQLYSAITGSLEVERKFQQKEIIPFTQTPKFVLASNYMPLDNDGSTQRRFKVCELHRYFSAKKQPADELGKSFWHDDFDVIDWTMFFAYLATCVVSYHQNGIYDFASDTIQIRMLQSRLNDDIIAAFDDLPRNQWLTNNELTALLSETDLKAASNQQIKNKLRFYCTTLDIQIIEESAKINGKTQRRFQLKD